VEYPHVGDEAVLFVSGTDAPAAAVRVWERVAGVDESGEEKEKEVAGVVGCRMLASGGQVGCVLGKGGKTVERMRQESGAQIRVFRNREQLPPCALQGDELIHVRISTPSPPFPIQKCVPWQRIIHKTSVFSAECPLVAYNPSTSVVLEMLEL
jgi:hypothetical protein